MKEHKHHLRLVLQQLSDYGIVINPTICVFGTSKLTFLGQQVSSDSIQFLEDKFHVIRQLPLLCTQRKLHEFLGLINFYHRFLPHGAVLLKPLNDLLPSAKTTNKDLIWTDSAISAFSAARGLGISYPTVSSNPKCSYQHHDWWIGFRSGSSSSTAHWWWLASHCILL